VVSRLILPAGTLKPRHAFTLKDVPAAAFIEAFAERLKDGGKVTVPEWAEYAKTSCEPGCARKASASVPSGATATPPLA